ncbi:glycoside hydrolase family 57 protein [Candidatus Saccharibacteria bacterium]|nr:glycoside hydrolase family 57 protein [Candidatus Saccharibacteria bacterium]
MRAICLYLHIHQPIRYREYSIFDVANDSGYFNGEYNGRQSNERIFKKVTQKSYRPMLNLLETNMKKYPGFKVSFSITGTWLEQAAKWAPELIAQIKRMVNTGQAEIIGETYYHSLAYFHNLDEFNAQVDLHAAKIQALFGVTPKVFRNTELAYNDSLAAWAENRGYTGILAEGWDKILGWRSPNHVYRPVGCQNLKLLLKNYRLSDDIAFRFSNRQWSEWPLTMPKYLDWLHMDALRGNLINLFMDFETFGEHQWADTGIFNFIDQLISAWLSEYENKFVTVSEACNLMEPVDEISMPETITWADIERDLSAWMSNAMQNTAMQELYAMRKPILASNDPNLIADWRLLTTSDHAYSMCTKYWHDGDVHAYFSAYASPYESFMYFMNVLRDLDYRLLESLQPKPGTNQA